VDTFNYSINLYKDFVCVKKWYGNDCSNVKDIIDDFERIRKDIIYKQKILLTDIQLKLKSITSELIFINGSDLPTSIKDPTFNDKLQNKIIELYKIKQGIFESLGESFKETMGYIKTEIEEIQKKIKEKRNRTPIETPSQGGRKRRKSKRSKRSTKKTTKKSKRTHTRKH
jgi:hypothetical protein